MESAGFYENQHKNLILHNSYKILLKIIFNKVVLNISLSCLFR